MLHDVRALTDAQGADRDARLNAFDQAIQSFENRFRQRTFTALRTNEIDGLQLSSLLNDLGYVGRISGGLRGLMTLRHDSRHGLLRTLRFDAGSEPLVVV